MVGGFVGLGLVGFGKVRRLGRGFEIFGGVVVERLG